MIRIYMQSQRWLSGAVAPQWSLPGSQSQSRPRTRAPDSSPTHPVHFCLVLCRFAPAVFVDLNSVSDFRCQS